MSDSVHSDIQEFYEVTLLDSQRWAESSKGADPMAPVNLWDFSSLQSTTVTSDTLPSLSTSIEVRAHNNTNLHNFSVGLMDCHWTQTVDTTWVLSGFLVASKRVLHVVS